MKHKTKLIYYRLLLDSSKAMCIPNNARLSAFSKVVTHVPMAWGGFTFQSDTAPGIVLATAKRLKVQLYFPYQCDIVNGEIDV